MKYVSKRKPRIKQAEALERITGRRAFALLMAMRCVDGDTEYLSPQGWKKISSYTGGKVAEFRLDGTAHFVKPKAYIKSPVDHFWHFKTSGGVDQVLSDHHRILICSRETGKYGKTVGRVPEDFRSKPLPHTQYWRETSPLEFLAFSRGYKDHIPTSFWLDTGASRIDLSDDEIRLMVAFHADGTIGYKGMGAIRVKRERKKKRLRQILSHLSIKWKEGKYADGYSRFFFRPPHVTKTYGDLWWRASYAQRLVIIDEVCHWDGFWDGTTRTHRDNGTRKYSSKHHSDVDFIQYCFASTGHRAVKITWKGRSRKYRGKMKRCVGGAQVTISGFGRTNNLALLPKPRRYRGKHNGYMYSFSVPSTYLVLRRNGKIFVTGNTGKTKVISDDWGRMVAENDIDNLLLIAPAGVYHTWGDEIAKDIPDRILRDTAIGVWISDSKKARQEAAGVLQHRGSRILLMNIEALSTVQDARDLCTDFSRSGRTMTVIDECFVAGTKIQTPFGQRSIENLCVGDLICSSDGISTIKTIFKKQSNVICIVRLSTGVEIKCTPNHPFFTDHGWVCAAHSAGRKVYDQTDVQNLQKTVSFASINIVEGETQEILWDILFSEMAHASAGSSKSRVHCGNGSQNSSLQNQEWYNGARSSIGQKGHSNVLAAASETEAYHQTKWSGLYHSWWQRAYTSGAAADFAEGIRLAMETGGRHRIGRKAAWLSNLLQGRFRIPEQEISCRVRRVEPQQFNGSSEGQEKGGQACNIRVESVAIEKCTSSVDVFDLELEGCPHFYTEGILVHNSVIIKSHTAKRTKFVNRVLAPLARYRRILSGLPTPRSPLDLYCQFEFLDPRILGFESFYRFRDRYAIVVPLPGRGRQIMIKGYRHVDELARKIAPYSFRVRLEDCYDLPESTYLMRDVPLTEEQERIYRELKKFATTTLSDGSHVTATQVITQILRLHQCLCGHTRDEEDNWHAIPEHRTRTLIELLDDHDGKAVIWCSYDPDIRKVSEALAKHFDCKVARFWGGNRDTREEEEIQFKTSPDWPFMVATAAAGGRGRTWDVADLVVYYSNDPNLDTRMQSEERVKNVGKKKAIAYVDLCAKGTVDEKILHALRNKINMAAVITSDTWKDWVV